MKRTKHSLSHYNLLTCDMGELIPVACFEVLPGDSVQQATSCLIRLSPLLAPVMHPVVVRVHHWFVPHRIVWQGWEDFITGGQDGSGDGSVYPTITLASGVQKGSLFDYLGVPPGFTNQVVSALPIRSYNMIWNEFYRDQDLQAAVSEGDQALKGISWEKDYFTASRPWPQKGPDVTIPLGIEAPVKGIGKTNQTYTGANPAFYETGASGSQASGSSALADTSWLMQEDPNNPGFPGIFADLTNATAANINDVRRAFALQRYQEARAMYGSRYTEYLRYLGVTSSDARLQRPEYLGGGKQTISFSEVLKTGAGEDPAEVIGTMKGHGIAAMRSRRYRRFFEEHGLVMSLLSVRPKTMYTEGLNRLWSRRAKEDYWQRELELIGQQEVYAREVYGSGDPAGAAVFGYNDRYSEYRHQPSRVTADFRDTLNHWHLARSFSTTPTLNAGFVDCDPSKRIHAEQTQDALWIMANHSIQARRMVGNPALPRIF